MKDDEIIKDQAYELAEKIYTIIKSYNNDSASLCLTVALVKLAREEGVTKEEFVKSMFNAWELVC